MKNVRTNIFRTFLLSLMTAGVLSSCIIDHQLDGVTPDGDGEKTVTFSVRVPGNASSTRALTGTQEDEVKEITVLVLNPGSKAVVRAERNHSTEPVKVGNTISFEVSLPIGGPYTVMVLANAQSLIDAKYINGVIPKGTTLADLQNNLVVDKGAAGQANASQDQHKWNTTVDASKGYLFPMWGMKESVTINEAPNQTISGINLHRMVSKIDVSVRRTEKVNNVDKDVVTADVFKMTEVYVLNYNTKGRVIPGLDAAYGNWTSTDATAAYAKAPTIPANPVFVSGSSYWQKYTSVDFTDTDKNTALTGQIYTFEADKGEALHTTRPCVIVGGRFMDGPTTYYRVDMIRSGTQEYMHMLRNHSYTVEIIKVSGPGYNDIDEAYKSKSLNITAQVIPWNDANMTDIVFDGQYYLAVSKGAFEFSCEKHTEADLNNKLTIRTDVESGWTATVYDNEGGTTQNDCGWLTLSADNGDGAGDGNTISLLTEYNDSGDDRTAFIHIEAGRLHYIMKVVQKYLYIKITDVISGEELSSLSFNSKNSLLGLAPTQRQVKVEWSPATEQVTVIKTPGAKELTWSSAYSTTLNGGAYVFTIDPEAITAADVTAPNEFLSKKTTLTFRVGGSSVTANLPIDQTHYQLIQSGIESVEYGTFLGTATIRCNAPWSSTVVQTPTVLASNGIPGVAAANETGASYNYTFNGEAGQATFTFKPVTTGLFDDVAVTIQSGLIAPFFAKSNIVLYIDADGNRILTFAEDAADFTGKTVSYKNKTDDTPRSFTLDGVSAPALTANVQGIHFRWGGLVGLSSNANASSSTAFNGTKDIQFWPEEYEDAYFAANGVYPNTVTWKYNNTPEEWAAATQVPYLGDQTIATNTNTYDAFVNYFDSDYFSAKGEPTTEGYDAKAGYGDICRYMSDKGWVEGNWRMPTRRELELLINETQNIGQIDDGYGNMQYGVMYGTYSSDTNWNYVQMTNPDATYTNYYGFTRVANARMVGGGITATDGANQDYLTKGGEARIVLPGAGSRAGSNGNQINSGNFGYYWGSTPGIDVFLGSYLNVIGSRANVNSITSRCGGLSIRCIREQ